MYLGLVCFECDGSAAPLCEGSIAPHLGRLNVSCPGPNTYIPHSKSRHDFNCGIIKSKSYATGRIEVMKGCVLSRKVFTVDKEGTFLKPGQCYVHDDNEVPRDAVFEELTVCICRTDNCNKRTLAGIGEEDIEQKQALRKRNTATLFTLSSVLIIVTILINVFL